MFAGATREVVFSDPVIIQAIQQDFVPVALKAGLVNNPPDGLEGRLYDEIRSTQAAPQGMCVMDSRGKVLDWVLSFDDPESMREFFSYAVRRFEDAAGNLEPNPTRRYRSYPSAQMKTIAGTGQPLDPVESFPEHECPGDLQHTKGAMLGKVIGRPLDKNGEPVDATFRQEDYMEATMTISPHAQSRFVEAWRQSDGGSFDVPDIFVSSLVGPAYLGQLDVSPLIQVPRGTNQRRWWQFTAQRISDMGDNEKVHLRLTGRSLIDGEGPNWEHIVALDWQGYAMIQDQQLTQVKLLAKGNERLVWHRDNLALINQPQTATLMGGHPIDMDGAVIYGISAKPWTR